jgi:hypothetical protein
MFNLKLDATPTYWWDVEVLVVKGDGEIVSRKIRVLFERIDEDAFEAFQAEIRDSKLDDRVVAKRIMRGLSRVVDESGTELPWGEVTRDALLRVDGVATAIVGNWYASRNQVHLGNLMRSRAAGPAPTTHPEPGATLN